jgi:UDP-2,3-diacylglucosamine hydrolase
MFPNKLQKGAIFIADAHENGENRKDFALFLQKVEEGVIKTPQLFLMGDIFDFFVGGAKYSLFVYERYIARLEKIAKNTQIYYIEGNHDFNLKNVFKNVEVIPLEKQPLYINCPNEKIKFAFSHGDINTGKLYNLYVKIIRNRAVVFVLNAIDIGGWISRLILKSQKDKRICREICDFEGKIENKIKRYEYCDFIVEGHYHQNRLFAFKDKTYISLASFACEKIFYIFDGTKFRQNIFEE